MADEKRRLSKFFHRSKDADEKSGNGNVAQPESEKKPQQDSEPAYTQPSASSSSQYPEDKKYAVPPPHESSSSASTSQQAQHDAPPPNYAPSKTTFASLSLHSHDKIRLMSFPNEIVEAVRDTIKRHYIFGIQSEKPNYGGAHEFKLSSYPWVGQGRDAIPSRIVIREILRRLWTHGWILLSGVDVSRKEADCDTLLFRHEPLTAASPPRRELDWIAVSFNEYDKVRLISWQPENLAPLIAAVAALLKSLSLFAREEWKDQSLGAYQFKCNKWIWLASGEETMRSRALLVGLLDTFEREGWALYASIDQVAATGDVSENDTWYIVREKGWVPGMKVWHR